MYDKTVTLKDSQILLTLDKETGEMEEIGTGTKRNPNQVTFMPTEPFIKTFPKAWQELYLLTTPLEYKVAQKMATMVKMLTNSLQPLTEETTYQELADMFGVSRSKVYSITKKLFSLGVYAVFKYSNADGEEKNFWVFNPYLAYNGKTMDMRTINLFSDTRFAKLYK